MFSHNLQGLGCVAGPDNTLSRCQPGTQYALCAAAMFPALEECCSVLLTDNSLLAFSQTPGDWSWHKGQSAADGIDVHADRRSPISADLYLVTKEMYLPMRMATTSTFTVYTWHVVHPLSGTSCRWTTIIISTFS